MDYLSLVWTTLVQVFEKRNDPGPFFFFVHEAYGRPCGQLVLQTSLDLQNRSVVSRSLALFTAPHVEQK